MTVLILVQYRSSSSTATFFLQNFQIRSNAIYVHESIYLFHFDSVFKMENRTRQRFWMNHIVHACMVKDIKYDIPVFHEGHKGHEGYEDISAYLHFSAFLYISLHFSTFLFISLHFCAFLCLSLHLSAFIYISLYFSAFLYIYLNF